MKQLSLALLLAAGTILAGCKSNESKPAETAPQPQSTAAPAPAPVATKPECPPEPAAKKKSTKETTKAKAAKKGEAAPVDCEPAKPKAAATTKAAEPAAPPPPPAKESPATGKACNPCVVKSKDGTFDGEVYGSIPSGSKWSKLQIGMHQSEVEHSRLRHGQGLDSLLFRRRQPSLRSSLCRPGQRRLHRWQLRWWPGHPDDDQFRPENSVSMAKRADGRSPRPAVLPYCPTQERAFPG